MLYDILVDFPGSQDGTRTEQFAAGTQRELSAYLAALVVPCGWARPVQAAAPVAEVENKPAETRRATHQRKGLKS